MKRTKFVSESLIPKSLVCAEEVAHPVVGDPGSIAHVRGPHDAEVKHHGVPPGFRAAAAAAHPPVATGVGGLQLELHVVGKALHLRPLAAAAIDRAHADLGEVGHEDIGKIDQDGVAVHRIERDDRQRHEHRIGEILLHGPFDGRAGGRLVMDVPLDDLDPVTDPAKDQHAVVVADGDPRLSHASGDGHRSQQWLVELIGPDLGEEVVARPVLVQREKALDLFRGANDLVEVLKGAGRAPVRAGRRAPAMTCSKSICALRPRLLC